jgi:hypothetical protein
MTEFRYEIDGKKYFQNPLVLGQVQQLIAFIKSKKIQIPSILTPWSVIESLGDYLSEGVAIVLREEDRPLKDKDVEDLAIEIKFSIEPETMFQVVEDFFDCNPIASTLERLAGTINRVVEKMGIGLKKPSPSSAAETSPGGMVSSGDLPRENANPSSDME